MTEDNAVNTDWLANSAYSYGYGYTKEQALMAMARNATREVEGDASGSGVVQIDLVEHIGSAKTGMGGWEVEEFVSGERVTISAERFNEIRDLAYRVDSLATETLVDPESVEELDF